MVTPCSPVLLLDAPGIAEDTPFACGNESPHLSSAGVPPALTSAIPAKGNAHPRPRQHEAGNLGFEILDTLPGLAYFHGTEPFPGCSAEILGGGLCFSISILLL